MTQVNQITFVSRIPASESSAFFIPEGHETGLVDLLWVHQKYIGSIPDMQLFWFGQSFDFGGETSKHTHIKHIPCVQMLFFQYYHERSGLGTFLFFPHQIIKTFKQPI